jgi:hypothetical protein
LPQTAIVSYLWNKLIQAIANWSVNQLIRIQALPHDVPQRAWWGYDEELPYSKRSERRVAARAQGGRSGRRIIGTPAVKSPNVHRQSDGAEPAFRHRMNAVIFP